MKYLLGVDFGGGASKATLLSEDGVIVASNTVEYPTSYPKPGFAEQNPEDWYNATRESIGVILKKTGINAADIAAICLDAATHTAVLADESFNVLRPAIYWTDSRSVAEVGSLMNEQRELILSQALHLPDTIWTLPQLMWVRNNEPEIFSRIKRIMFAKDYVRYRFTGVYITDYIEAEGSMLFDFNTLDWSPELCALAGIDMSILPKTCAPCDVIGFVTPEAALDTGLAPGTKVIGGTTDTALEVFASGAVNVGQMTVKLATAGRICVVTDKAYPNRHLINYSHVAPGLWYPGTATKSCAASYRWYRDTFGGDYRELDAGAAELAPGADGLFFHPYLSGELTPYADPLLRGSFTGMRSGHTRAHFSRAVLEGVAFSLLDCMTALSGIGIPHNDEATIIGGGSTSPLWRQIVSDMLGIRLIKTECADSSFGGAMLAGVASGIFGSLEDAVEKCVKRSSVTEPNPENTARYAELFPIYKELHDALAGIYHKF